MGIVGNLSPDQLHSFNSQGYFVIESFPSAEDIDEMRKRMDQLLHHFDCSSTASMFSTKNQRVFGNDGELQQPKELSINKVGHGKL